MTTRPPLRTTLRNAIRLGATALWFDLARESRSVNVLTEDGPSARLSQMLAPYTLYICAHFAESGARYPIADVVRTLGYDYQELDR